MWPVYLTFALLSSAAKSSAVDEMVQFSFAPGVTTDGTTTDAGVDASCPGCAARPRVADANLIEMELENLKLARLEYYKFLILKKLQLEAPPNVSASSARAFGNARSRKLNLPDVLTTHDQYMRHDSPVDRKLDDFYGKTTQYILFAKDGSGDCPTVSTRSRVCLQFDLKEVAPSDAIVTTKLYAFKHDMGDRQESVDRFFQVRQVNARAPATSVVSHAVSVGGTTFVNNSGWVRFDLHKDVIRSWVNAAPMLEILCKHCSTYPFPYSEDYKPFILVEVEKKSRDRNKRNNDKRIECSQARNRNATCCVESLYVSFKDIGWNWILEPKGFYPNFCRGPCTGYGQQIIYPHTNIVRSMTSGGQTASAGSATSTQSGQSLSAFRYIPCCAPVRMSSIDILYYINDGTVVTKKTLPNMIVDECGCL